MVVFKETANKLVSYENVSQRLRQNTAACDSLSNINNVKDRICSYRIAQKFRSPNGADTIQSDNLIPCRGERRLYRINF
jgi:hypothetical protein